MADPQPQPAGTALGLKPRTLVGIPARPRRFRRVALLRAGRPWAAEPGATVGLPQQRQAEAHAKQFSELCQANPDAVLELAADGSLICMTPTGSDTGARNADLLFPIKTWTRATGGWKAFDSSTGFRLPDNSVLSPDASLVALARWQALSERERCGFLPSAPIWSWNWPVRVTKAPRGLTPLRRKMAAYQRNGARLGWRWISRRSGRADAGPRSER